MIRDERRRDALIVFATALMARLLVVAWAATRFPPTADGTFYHRIASRIAQGLGYTWLWPDGVVTYAGHYPVGYPALIGAAYAVFGTHPGVAMVLNACFGALAALAVYGLSLRASTPRLALIAGLVVALHPGLVAYTPALMSEGVTAAFVTCAAWITMRMRETVCANPSRLPWKWLIFLGFVMGIASLVRPQNIVFAPMFAFVGVYPWFASRSWKRAVLSVGAATFFTLALIAPWTARNCSRMGRCALVSYNGGWNLLIGADFESTGAWSPIKVPKECREVWDEAAKDECFGRAAQRYIKEHSVDWIRLIPLKLGATFNYCGAAGWYLKEANSEACGDGCKTALGVIETIYERILLAMAIIWAARDAWKRTQNKEDSPLEILRLGLVAVGILFVLQNNVWLSYVAFVLVTLLRSRDLFLGPVLPTCTMIVVGMTALVHAVFFGAGRYSLVTFPLLAGVAILALKPRPSTDYPGISGEVEIGL